MLLQILSLLLAVQLACAFRPSSPLLPYKRGSEATVKMSSIDSSSNQPQAPVGMTFTNYVVYKGKCAVAVKVIAPSFSSIGGNSNNKISNSGAKTITKEGGLLLEFANATGQRVYDWGNKGTFFMSATECGGILACEKQSLASEFVHDPNIDKPNAGQVLKRLKWTPTNDDNGYFMGLQVSDKSAGAPVTYTVPLTWAEVEVLCTLIRYCIPHFLGFDRVWSNPGMGDNAPFVQAPIPQGPPSYQKL